MRRNQQPPLIFTGFSVDVVRLGDGHASLKGREWRSRGKGEEMATREGEERRDRAITCRLRVRRLDGSSTVIDIRDVAQDSSSQGDWESDETM